jgi:hypothetical protein
MSDLETLRRYTDFVRNGDPDRAIREYLEVPTLEWAIAQAVEAAELRKDRERLQWLVNNAARVLLSGKTYYVEMGGLAVAMDKTWRDAIDAAMEGEG